MLWNDLRRFERGWDPWQELRTLQREMDRVSSRIGEASVTEFPAMNVWSGSDDLVVTCELPGVDPKDLDISVVKETLTLKGSRVTDKLKPGERYHRRERGYGDFTRSIQLPYMVDADKVAAHYDKGVLRISLPRAAQEKPRKIAVKAS